MSLRQEQYWAIQRTRDFLRELLRWKGYMNKKEVRERAYRCLKHFPFLHENGQPMWSKDEFTKDVEE